MERSKNHILYVSMVLLVAGLMLIPTASAFYWTDNPPPDGFRGPPAHPGQRDVMPGVWGTDRLGGGAFLKQTGSTNPNNPYQIALHPGETLVFVADSGGRATCTEDSGLDYTRAMVYVELLHKNINNEWIAIDWEFEFREAYPGETILFNDEYFHLYHPNHQYIVGDEYQLSVRLEYGYVEDCSYNIAYRALASYYYIII